MTAKAHVPAHMRDRARAEFATSLAAVLAGALVLGTVGCQGSEGADERDRNGGAGGAVAGAGGDRGAQGGQAGAQRAEAGAGGAETGGAASGGGGGRGGGGEGPAEAMGGAGLAAAGGGAPPPAYAFAHDFEGDELGAPPAGGLNNENDSAVVDGTHAHSGTKALKIFVDAADDHTAGMVTVRTADLLPRPIKTVYARFMLWMDGLPGINGLSNGQGGHWDLIAHHGIIRGGGKTIQGFLSFGAFAEDTYKLHMFGDEIGGGGGRQDCTRTAPMDLPTRRWVCIEVKVDENDVFNYGVKVNGTEISAFSFIYDTGGSACVPDWNIMNGIWYLPEIQFTKFGFRHWHPQAKPVTLWLDDLAIDDEPIGCPAP